MTHTQATKNKIRKARLGTHHSKATIAKIQAAMQERAALVRQGLLPAYHHTEATKAKMRKAAKHRKPSKKAVQASIVSRQAKSELANTMEAIEPGYKRRLLKTKRQKSTK